MSKQKEEAPKQYDLAGREIKEGDWIVQSFSLGRCAAIKFAKVVGFAQSGVPRLYGFERSTRWGRNPETGKQERQGIYWERSRGMYTIQMSERSFVIRPDDLPQDLLIEIETKYHGDVAYEPQEV